MSVFQGATNVAIHGGVFNAVANTVANVGAQDDILGTLYARSAPAGLLDAAERFDAPKCDEGTRTSMIHGMQKFVQEGGATSSSALYWLHGPAGVGKSALAQSVSLLLKGQADHAASFFFSRTSPGRNNGNQLVVTLAYQLAVNLPALQPFMSRIVRTNPAVLAASNAVQMQSLIIDSVNQWQKEAKGGTIRRWRRKIFNIKKRPHPRLILVDGLDECNDPQVQRDLLLCIALAVRHLSLPFRFIVTSRPEPHILATFELDPTFQGPDGVSVLTKNLGDDEDADEQITTFLLKEFAEIRRTHPIREFLPKVWPLPGQIAQLVSKSSKVFIYPATVIRYIKMANNRPDECLERILGLEDIPIEDKPYEPLDILYRHIFGSVPNANKEAVWNIFHFLVVPYTCRPRPITSRRIEQHFDYKPGHVQHVLRDLLCIVSVTGETIKVLHASLPDFLLDPSRSGSLCIDISNAHAAIAASFPLAVSDMAELPDFRFNGFLEHIMQANISSALVQRRLVGMDFSARYIRFFAIYFRVGNRKSSRSVQDRLDGITFVVAYLLVLVIKNVQQIEIRRHITEIKGYILHNSPLAASLYAVRDEIFSVMVSVLL
ncbi:hypothetical protein D9619_004179 [Psilocybe cf. subviscida]|uniref:Nephrocystin 3-like N-terminal domain-containing protein n=1 Tax=Psilocybe cf. subviscida TaxID=2480587 RepID=A0A8H5F8D3_9AGAR|nr:hypothetical protein D9619_004179 [Psilocybe cf. subviscida]